MSASELIEQLKSLPARVREAFTRLFRELETSIVPAERRGNGASHSSGWPDFPSRLKRIYGDRVAAGSEAVILYTRGEW